jgi:hypothetical protein
MPTLLNPDWKKYAAAAAQPDMTNDDAERSFGDLAYNAISSKAAPLMKAPYRVGFEIVFKNDSNTRMVGIFIFRVGKDLFYAPVFFINGSIKGTDLLYRQKVKRFVPLTNSWVEYLVGLGQIDEGFGVPLSMRSEMRNQLKLHDVVRMPVTKYSSADTEAKQAWAEMQQQPELKEDLLRHFIEEDGGFSAMHKLAAACDQDFDFASALFLLSKPENYRPDLDPQLKAAGVESEPLITMHTGLLHNDQVKRAAAEDLQRGYLIEDRRKAAELGPVAYAPASESLQMVTEPGVYSVLKNDGSTEEMLVGYKGDLDLDCSCPCINQTSYGAGTIRPLCMVSVSRKQFGRIGSSDKAYGHLLRYLNDKETPGEAKPSSGQAYCLLNVDAQTLSDPFYVTKVESGDGSTLTRFYVTGYYTDNEDPNPWSINPDWRGVDTTSRILGACCRFVPVGAKVEDKRVSFDRDLNLGGIPALNQFIFDQGYKSASVARSTNDSYLVSLAPEAGAPNWTPELSKAAATLGLMCYGNMAQDTAEALLKVADEKQTVSFFYKPAAVKEGHSLSFSQWPDLEAQYNNEFNVLEAPQSRHILRAERVQPEIRRHRVGDMLPVGGTEGGEASSLETMTPMELFGLSRERGNSSLFEHGVVGALVNTYDSIALIDKYMPDLEQGLDRLGRALFLFYWKPEDFARAYGSDDQTQMENKMVSCFKSLGDLVLELLRKNKQDNTDSDNTGNNGTASLV